MADSDRRRSTIVVLLLFGRWSLVVGRCGGVVVVVTLAGQPVFMTMLTVLISCVGVLFLIVVVGCWLSWWWLVCVVTVHVLCVEMVG